jgi:isopenicillin N synthase-like dioxygenase
MTELRVIPYPEIVDGSAAASLDVALRDPGAFRLTDVPIRGDLLDDLHRVTAAFFALPLEEKQTYRYPSDQYTGWCGGDYLAEYGSRDYKEMFHIGPRVAPTLAAHGPDGALPLVPEDVVEAALQSCSLWPLAPFGFISQWHEYYRGMQQVAAGLGTALAGLLGVPRHVWFAAMGGNWADLAANYYPPVAAGDKGRLPVYNAAHRDLTVFTVLHQDQSRSGGLSVQTVGGAWIDVEPLPDTYVVNAGELLTYLSGGRWVAAPHQVTAAPDQPGAGARISVPFFYRPSDERVIASFVDDRAEPVAVGQWVADRKRGVGAATP